MPIPTKILILLFSVSGLAHLVSPEVFLPLMPPLPLDPILLIYLSGIAELVVAAGLGFKLKYFPIAAALLLLAIWPANWWFALEAISNQPTWVMVLAWLRLPLQIPLIVFALRSQVRA